MTTAGRVPARSRSQVGSRLTQTASPRRSGSGVMRAVLGGLVLDGVVLGGVEIRTVQAVPVRGDRCVVAVDAPVVAGVCAAYACEAAIAFVTVDQPGQEHRRGNALI